MASPQPPHDLNAERLLLGAMTTDATRARAAMNGSIDTDAFYAPSHQHVYTAIVALDDAGLYVDIGVITDRLRQDGLLDTIGGPATVIDICRLDQAPPPEAAGQYAIIVARYARQRRLLAATTEARLAIEDGDTDAAIRRLTHAVDHDTGTGRAAGRVTMVDWPEAWARDRAPSDWAWEPLLPRGKATNLYAPRGIGKSELALYGAAAMATGKPALNRPPGDPLSVVYIDLEMGEDDLIDRLTDLGYGPGDDLTNLHYTCLPELPAMNTPEGGAAVLDVAREHHADVVIVDTLARVVNSEENSNDTWIGLATYTILRLKALNVTSLWLGHAGKDIERGERGGSAKGDAVDCIWKQQRGDGGTIRLTNEKRRASWVPETVDLHRTDHAGAVTYELAGDMWPEGTNVVVVELDHLNAPLDISRRSAAALLRAAGAGARNDVIGAAVKWRRQRPSGDTP